MQPLHDAKIVEKPWGHEIWYAHTPAYAGKLLDVHAGQRLSLQMHEIKSETLYLLTGHVTLTFGTATYDWLPGTAVDIPTGTVHRIEALAESVILEVSTPHLDDVIRLSDDYGRGA